MHIPRINKVFQNVSTFSLLISVFLFFLQSCKLATNNLPSIIRDAQHIQPNHLPIASLNLQSEAEAIASESSLPILSIAQVFTASSGEKISFLEEAGIWKAQMPASYLGVGIHKTMPVICEHQGDILTMLNRLAKQRTAIHKHRIHILPTPSQSQCVFLGTAGLLGGMEDAEASASACIALHEAVTTENLALVESLLYSGADPNRIDHNGVSPLENATWQGYLALVNLLLEKGANPNQPTSLNYSCLHLAAMKNYVEMAKVLIEHGANINATTTINNIRYTPLDLAMNLNYVAVVQLLLEKGAKPSTTKEGLQIFHWAAEEGHLEILNLLLENYAEFINIRYQDGFTLLSLAVKRGHIAIVKLLLDKGVDPNMSTEDGLTPLHWAAEQGHLELAKLLFEKGANLNNVDNEAGFAPLHLAIDQSHVAVLRLLLDKGADPNIAAENGCTPLHWAAYAGHLEQINLLIEKGANLNITDYEGWTPLHIAANQGHLAIILGMLAHQPDLNMQTNHGETFLHILVDSGIHSLQEVLQGIESTQQGSLNKLLAIMEDYCPTLTNNDTKRILAMMVDYVQGLNVSLKNQEDNTVLDILTQVDLEEAEIKAAEQVLRTLQRNQILGGWLTLPKPKRGLTAISNDSSMHESALKKAKYE